jgi:hypothetical protein
MFQQTPIGLSLLSGLENDHPQITQITQRGLGRNQTAFSLQRSQMFIEIGYEHEPRSSGAQCVRQFYAGTFSLRWSEEYLS